MIEESIKSIKADLYDRVSSPLIFGFCVSWCAWNYKLFLVILSDEKVLEKFRIIDEVLYRTDYHILFNGILYPLLSALIYIFVYPYPAKFIFSFYKKKQTEIVSVKKEIENGVLLTLEESFSIRSKIDKLEREYEEVIKRKNEEISIYKNNAENYENMINSSDFERINSHIEEDALYVLDRIEQVDGVEVLGTNRLFDEIDSRKLRHIIDELERKEYLHITRNISKDDVYDVTPLGRSILVEKDMGIPS
jgi:hypothetical protein